MTDGHSQGAWGRLDSPVVAARVMRWQAHPMSPPLSDDIRRRIVELRAEGHTLRAISSRLKVSLGAVHNTVSNFSEYGEYSNPSCRRTGRPPILDDDDATYLKALLEADPSIYLDEIKCKLEKVRNVSVSMSTISRFLRKQEFTWKAMAREAKERNQQLQTCYEVETALYDDPSYFVFIDESHVDQKTAQRKNGWSPIGLSPVE